MIALMHAEVLKLRSRTATGMLIATLALVALTVGVSVPKVGDTAAPVSLHDPTLLATMVASGFGVPQVLVVLLGVLAFTQEFRYGTATATYLGEPRRVRVLVAKLTTLALVSILVTLATLAVAMPFAVVLINSRHGKVTMGAQFWQTVAAAFVVMAAYAVIGVALGTLIRNQIIAVVAVLVYMLAVEYTIVPTFPSIGRWLPLGVVSAFLQMESTLGLDGKLLPTAAAGLVLLVYTIGALGLALRLTPRRDVL